MNTYQQLAAGFVATSLALLPFFAFAANGTSGSDDKEKKPTREHQIKIKDDYLALWSGDVHLAEKVLSPNVVLNIDRHPTATGSETVVVNNIKEFMDFLNWSRAGWEKFGFKVEHWAADGHNIAVRWKLEAIMGPNYPTPTALKHGDECTYNGTDFLVLNKETGLVDEVNIAADMLNLLHAMGMRSVPL